MGGVPFGSGAVALLLLLLASTDAMPTGGGIAEDVMGGAEALQGAIIKQMDAQCYGCKALFFMLRSGLTEGGNYSEGMVKDSAVYYCMQNHLSFNCSTASESGCHSMCNGLVDSFLPVFLEVIGNSSDITAEDVCSTAHFCNSELRIDDEWSVQLILDLMTNTPALLRAAKEMQPTPDPALAAGSTSFSFAQITDIHIDRGYQAGTESACDQPVCCHTNDDGTGSNNDDGDGSGGSGGSNNNDGDSSGGGGGKSGPSSPAGIFGDFNCDLPAELLTSALEAVSSLLPAFVVWTGDSAPHDIWVQSRGSNIAASAAVTDAMTARFPSTPIFPCVGNHEAFPVDMFRPDPEKDAWLYTSLAEQWSHWLPAYALDKISRTGYYTVTLQEVTVLQDTPSSQLRGIPPLRIVALNTNLWIRADWYAFLDQKGEQGGQLEWLEETLGASEEAGESVMIIGHSCPAEADQSDELAAVFNMIVARYRRIIIGQFYGHTHVDSFKVTSDVSSGEEAVPTSVAYIAPSLTPFKARNPSFRIFHAGVAAPSPAPAPPLLPSPSALIHLTDYDQYRADLTKHLHQLTPEPPLVWTRAYKATTEYSMPDLKPLSWLRVAASVQANDFVFQDFATHLTGGVLDPTALAPTRRAELVCQLITSTPRMLESCVASKLGASYVPSYTIVRTG